MKFFQAGLLDFEQATSTLERVPVADLKQFLSKNNIQPKGRKSEIIDTIIECIDKKVIAATFPPKAVTLTGKGAAIVAHKEKVDRDTRFRSSSADAKKHLQTGQLFAYCDDLMHIANIDIAENRYLDAIRTLLSRFCIEIVGIPDTGFFAREAEFREFNHKHKTNIHSCIVPYTVRTIRTAKENAHITELDFRKLFYAHVTKDAIPYGFCSVDEVYELVTLALDNPDAANERLSGFIARFKKRNKLL